MVPESFPFLYHYKKRADLDLKGGKLVLVGKSRQVCQVCTLISDNLIRQGHLLNQTLDRVIKQGQVAQSVQDNLIKQNYVEVNLVKFPCTLCIHTVKNNKKQRGIMKVVSYSKHQMTCIYKYICIISTQLHPLPNVTTLL